MKQSQSPHALAPRWSVAVANPTHLPNAYAAISGGTAFLPVGQSLVALGLDDGKARWRSGTSAFTPVYALGQPARIVAQGAGKLAAYAASSGNLVWSMRARELQAGIAPDTIIADRFGYRASTGARLWDARYCIGDDPTVFDGIVLSIRYEDIASDTLYALDAKTGACLWYSPYASIPFGLAGEAAYYYNTFPQGPDATPGPADIVIADLSTGPIASFKLPGNPDKVTIYGEYLFTADKDRVIRYHRFNLATGNQNCTLEFSIAGDRWVGGPYQDEIFFGGSSGLTAINIEGYPGDRSDLGKGRRVPEIVGSVARMSSVGNAGFVGMEDGRLFILDLPMLQIKGSAQTKCHDFAEPIGAERTVLIACRDSSAAADTVYAFPHT